MQVDIYAKSQKLLETLANSIHDREPKYIPDFCFSLSEIHATEKWLKDFVREIMKSDREIKPT